MSIIYKYKDGTTKTINNEDNVSFPNKTVYSVIMSNAEVWHKAHKVTINVTNGLSSDRFTVSGAVSTSFYTSTSFYVPHGKSITLSGSNLTYVWEIDGVDKQGPSNTTSGLWKKNFSTSYTINEDKTISIVRGDALRTLTFGANYNQVALGYTIQLALPDAGSHSTVFSGLSSTEYVPNGIKVYLTLTRKSSLYCLINISTGAIDSNSPTTLYYTINSDKTLLGDFNAVYDVTVEINKDYLFSYTLLSLTCPFGDTTKTSSNLTYHAYPKVGDTSWTINLRLGITSYQDYPYVINPLVTGGEYSHTTNTRQASLKTNTRWSGTCDYDLKFTTFEYKEIRFAKENYTCCYVWHNVDSNHKFASSQSGTNSTTQDWYYTSSSSCCLAFTVSPETNQYYQFSGGSNCSPRTVYTHNLGYIPLNHSNQNAVAETPDTWTPKTIDVSVPSFDTGGWGDWTWKVQNNNPFTISVNYNTSKQSAGGNTNDVKTIPVYSTATLTAKDQAGFGDDHIIVQLHGCDLSDGVYIGGWGKYSIKGSSTSIVGSGGTVG